MNLGTDSLQWSGNTETPLFPPVAPKASLSVKSEVPCPQGWSMSEEKLDEKLSPGRESCAQGSSGSFFQHHFQLVSSKSQKHRSHPASTIILATVGAQWGGERGGVILGPSQPQFLGSFVEHWAVSLLTQKWCYYSSCHDVTAVTLSRIELAQICGDVQHRQSFRSWILSPCWNSWGIFHVYSSWKSICIIMATTVNKNPPNSCSSSSTWLF